MDDDTDEADLWADARRDWSTSGPDEPMDSAQGNTHRTTPEEEEEGDGRDNDDGGSGRYRTDQGCPVPLPDTCGRAMADAVSDSEGTVDFAFDDDDVVCSRSVCAASSGSRSRTVSPGPRASAASAVSATAAGAECRGRLTVELPTSTLISPRSAAVNYEPPLPATDEHDALEALRRASARIDVDDFEIYSSNATYGDRLRSLHQLGSSSVGGGGALLFLDGVLCSGAVRVYVQRVPFAEAPISGYGAAAHDTVRGRVSICSVCGGGQFAGLRYRLRTPSAVYARFHQPFLWVADLAKHFVDFVDATLRRKRRGGSGNGGRDAVAAAADVRIGHFRAGFAQWLRQTHARSSAVAAWRARFGGADRADFRSAVVAYAEFLRRETARVLGACVAEHLGVFREVAGTLYAAHPPRVPRGLLFNRRGVPMMPLPTVATPFVYDLFSGLAIHKYMRPVARTGAVASGNASLLLPQHETPFITGRAAAATVTLAERIRQIRPGDVVSTAPDGKMTGSRWWSADDDAACGGTTRHAVDAYWYALVHRVKRAGCTGGAGRAFDVVWLYRPQHTPCRKMTYPWHNELFLSDHCTCGEGGGGDDEDDFEIRGSEVTGVYSVEWFGGPDTRADFFVRQTYVHGDRAWVQLRLGHVFCRRSVREALATPWFAARFGAGDVAGIGAFEDRPGLRVGDTVLAVLAVPATRSEPFEVAAMTPATTPAADNDDDAGHQCHRSHRTGRRCTMFRLRRLLRRREVDAMARDAPPNELVYTDELVDAVVRDNDDEDEDDGDDAEHAAPRIVGRCMVRVFGPRRPIPTPYDRDGAGNVFFITHRLRAGVCVPVVDAATDAPSLRQGFDPATPVPRLRALDLFCGCGNLGRGLEDAGAIETRWANDIWPKAVHTYMANVPAAAAAAGSVAPFIGSVDTLLEHALEGRYVLPSRTKTDKTGKTATTAQHPVTRVPAPGEVDFLSGGSPCQGFSLLTSDKTTPQQFKNRSMVASFASFVDLYRPRFGLLENVPAMVASRSSDGGPGEDIFGQLVCTLLALGYQLRIVLANACAHGAPQHRVRVFLLFAAPGRPLPAAPWPSHNTPAATEAATEAAAEAATEAAAAAATTAKTKMTEATETTGGRRSTVGGGSTRVQHTVGRLVTGEWIAGDGMTAGGGAGGPAALSFVTARTATADLDEYGGSASADLRIDDGAVDICVRQPDHRLVVGVSTRLRLRMACIPTQPYGLGLSGVVRNARRHGLSPAQRALFSDRERALAASHAYRRAHPDRLFGTVRTQCVVADARSAGDIHWQALRPLTVLEMRRAQGLPDDDVLLSRSKQDQWKLVGNAVARPMALALGLSLRAAWLGTLWEE